jgi:carbon monoxide dehydrogenase subunit G
MQRKDVAGQGLGGFGGDPNRHQRVIVINLSRTTRVERDPDWVFRELHQPQTLLGCVPGGSLTRVIDPEHFTGCVEFGAGLFKFASCGEGRIIDSDPKARTASLKLHGLAGKHMPDVRIWMSMAVHRHSCGSEVQMSFLVTVVDRAGWLRQGWVDPIASDVLDRTVRRIKRRLEASAVAPGPAAA